jgi:hypothetical protein
MARRNTLAPASIESLKEGKVVDSLTQGLWIEIKNGRPVWHYRRRVPGTDVTFKRVLAVGAVAAKIIGSIGVVGMGSGIGIPVGLLALGGGALLSAAGYTAGDIAYGLLNKVDLADLALGASAMGIGLALLIDGARRVVGDDAVRQGASRVTAAAIELFRANATVVARSVAELAPYERDAAALGLAALAGWGGAAAGGAYAATSVTVLGSSTLGSLALGMGLVAAPVWPMVLGAAAAAVGGGLLARRILRSRRK